MKIPNIIRKMKSIEESNGNSRCEHIIIDLENSTECG